MAIRKFSNSLINGCLDEDRSPKVSKAATTIHRAEFEIHHNTPDPKSSHINAFADLDAKIAVDGQFVINQEINFCQQRNEDEDICYQYDNC